MAENPFDLPFALLYQISPEADRARLVAAAGIEAGRSASPEEIMLRQDNGGDTWPLGEVVRTGAAVSVEDLDTRFRDLPSALDGAARRFAPDPDRSSRPERARGGPRRRSQPP